MDEETRIEELKLKHMTSTSRLRRIVSLSPLLPSDLMGRDFFPGELLLIRVNITYLGSCSRRLSFTLHFLPINPNLLREGLRVAQLWGFCNVLGR